MTQQDSDSFNMNLLKDTGPSSEGLGAQSDEATGASFAAHLAGGGEEGYVIPTKKKQVSGGTVAFIGLAVLAGGGLWLMYQRNAGPAEATADTQVAEARSSIQQFLAGGTNSVDEMKSLLDDSERIKERFLSYSEDKQVPLDALKTNPFWHEDLTEEEVVEPKVDPGQLRAAELARRAEEERRQEQERIAAAAAKLELQTLFYGRNPTCMINGRICRVGQMVDDFVVEAIRPDSVQVRQGEYTFELRARE